MTLFLGRTLKRASAGLMLAVALMYLLHSVQYAAVGAVALPPSGEAVALELDPFVLAEAQSGDGMVGCHFFCNHGCPIPPLPVFDSLPETPLTTSYETAPAVSTPHRYLQPSKAPPRNLA